jgi:hypothetical protein
LKNGFLEQLRFSKDSTWVETTLSNPLPLWSYLYWSRKIVPFCGCRYNGFNGAQKMMLGDRVGLVPAAAEKHPGVIPDGADLEASVEEQPDTLRVTLSLRIFCNGVRIIRPGMNCSRFHQNVLDSVSVPVSLKDLLRYPMMG